MTHPSAELVVDLARERQVAGLQELSALDSKAATLLGLVGVALGLIFQVDLATDHWNWVFTGGVGLLGLAVALLALTILPSRYRFDPSVGALIEYYLDEDVDETRAAVAGFINDALNANQRRLRFKSRALSVATIFLMVGFLAVAARLLYLAA